MEGEIAFTDLIYRLDRCMQVHVLLVLILRGLICICWALFKGAYFHTAMGSMINRTLRNIRFLNIICLNIIDVIALSAS